MGVFQATKMIFFSSVLIPCISLPCGGRKFIAYVCPLFACLYDLFDYKKVVV